MKKQTWGKTVIRYLLALLWGWLTTMAPLRADAQGRGGYDQFGEYVDEAAINQKDVLKLQQDRMDAKLHFYRAKIKQSPKNASAYFFLGDLLTELDRHDEAVASYEQAVSIKPDHGEYRYRLAKAYHAVGKGGPAFEQAVAAEKIFRENLYVHWQTKTKQLIKFLRKEYGFTTDKK